MRPVGRVVRPTTEPAPIEAASYRPEFQIDDDVDPYWRAPEINDHRGEPLTKWRGTGMLKCSLAEALEWYPAPIELVRDTLREAVAIMGQRGVSLGPKAPALPRPSAADARPVPLGAINAGAHAACASIEKPFNLNVVAQAAVEDVIRESLADWTRAPGRTADDVFDLFYRAIYRVEHFTKEAA